MYDPLTPVVAILFGFAVFACLIAIIVFVICDMGNRR